MADQRQPRQPEDLQGLLRFALQAAAYEPHGEGEAPPPGPLDEQRRRFLEEALNSLTIDVTKVLQDGINTLSDRETISGISVQDQVSDDVFKAFDDIENHTSNIDVAIGFYKLGGFSVFPVCLSCENSIIRNYACRLLGSLCQNNPFCQTKVLENGYLQTLISMFNTEQDDDLLQSIMYGISCVIRHHEACIKAFLKDGGYLTLKKALLSSIVPLQIKAAFLITSIFPDNTLMTGDLLSEGVVEALLKALPKKRSSSSEHILCALATILSTNDKSLIDESRISEYELNKTLANYLEDEELKRPNTDFLEEKEYCERILFTAFQGHKSGKRDDEPSIDR